DRPAPAAADRGHGRGARRKVRAPAQLRGHGAGVRLRVRRTRAAGEGAAGRGRARARALAAPGEPYRPVAAMGIAMTSRLRLGVWLVTIALGLGACGNKGPLVLPDQADKAKSHKAGKSEQRSGRAEAAQPSQAPETRR